MKKVFFSEGEVQLLDVPVPQLKPGTVLVKNHYSFVSRGTELATLSNTKLNFETATSKGLSSTKKIIEILRQKGLVSTFYQVKSQFFKKLEVGYATSGVVVASASKDFREGDFVACAGAQFATHAEYSLVPTNLLAKIPDKKYLRDASVCSIGAIALQGLRRANLQLGEMVCVVGLGLLGQITVQLAKLSGLVVVGVDINPERQKLALSLGADKVFSALDQNWESDVWLYSQRLGVDGTLLTAGGSSFGNKTTIDSAIGITRKKGKIVVIGDIPLSFAREEFYQKELDLLISCSYGPGRYDVKYEEEGHDYPYAFVRWTEGRNLQCIIDLIVAGKLVIDSLIAAVYPVEQAKEAYNLLKEGALGVVFQYEFKRECLSSYLYVENTVGETGALSEFKRLDCSKKDNLGVALVGAGGFAKTILAPILTRLTSILLDTVVDTSASAAMLFRDTYNFLGWSGDVDHVLSRPDIDLVVITTNDSTHYSLVAKALGKGKAVLVEKPMVTNWQEYFALHNFLEKYKDSFFAVDFNRSYSPMIKRLFVRTQNRSTPLFINYRVNAGLSSVVGSFKRLVGEVCHFFELFIKMVEQLPLTMTVSFSGSRQVAFEENLTIALVFPDGSITNLLYSSLAHHELCKERGEFFWDRKSAILEDFTSLIGYGLGGDFDYYDIVPDKGHASLVSEFICSIKQNDVQAFSNNWQRYFMASWLSLKLEELILQNGGSVSIADEFGALNL